MGTDLISVGIDVGTTTTQLIFSRIHIENTASYFSVPKLSIVDKQIVFCSEIIFTPYRSEHLIDGPRLREFVEGQYRIAGFSPGEIGTGAVIITGESAHKENARAVIDELSGLAGEFVVSTAGPDLEAILAGKGSGAQRYSEEKGCVTVNLDIGGGTTNIVLFEAGEVIAKGSLDIGGRQICFGDDLTVLSMHPGIRQFDGSQTIEPGKKTTLEALRRVCSGMNAVLEQVLGLSTMEEQTSRFVTAGSIGFHLTRPIDAICFSGGVADGIYRAEPDLLRYHDIGMLLGEAIRRGRLSGAFRLIPARETIRATVVGAGIYSATVSGSTIAYTETLFPMKNIPILRLSASEEDACFQGDSKPLAENIQWYFTQSGQDHLAIAMCGRRSPSYAALLALGDAIAKAAEQSFTPKAPLIVLLESDFAKALGQVLRRALPNREIVCLDGLRAESGDYIDMGKPLMDGQAIPVFIKTLIFG